MAEITPPLFQTIDGVYNGGSLGLPYRDLVSEGVVSGLAVVQRAAGANMSVDIGGGVVWVRGDDSSVQPTYRCYNDSTVNLAVAAAHATLGRVDRVVAEVRDASFSGVSTDWRLRVITGTPSGSPTAPAEPNNAITLATVSVPAVATSITTARITDARPVASQGVPSGAAVTLATYSGHVAASSDTASGFLMPFSSSVLTVVPGSVIPIDVVTMLPPKAGMTRQYRLTGVFTHFNAASETAWWPVLRVQNPNIDLQPGAYSDVSNQTKTVATAWVANAYLDSQTAPFYTYLAARCDYTGAVASTYLRSAILQGRYVLS